MEKRSPTEIDLAMSAAIIEKALEDAGRLANNHEIVQSLHAALIGGQRSESMVPMCLEETIEEAAWADRKDQNGNRFRHARFVDFIEAPEPAGLGTTEDAIRKYLGDSSNPLRVKFETLLETKQGNPVWANQQRDDGRFTRIPDDIRDSDGPLPLSPKPKRDRSREPQAGTSIGYAVRRLEREAPNNPVVADAYEKLKAGEISANAAAIAAGFRTPMIQVPVDPVRAGRLLTRHFTPDEIAQLVQAYHDALPANHLEGSPR